LNQRKLAEKPGWIDSRDGLKEPSSQLGRSDNAFFFKYIVFIVMIDLAVNGVGLKLIDPLSPAVIKTFEA
jgi:hypothetical protein